MLLLPLDEFDAEKWCWAKSSEEGTRDAAHRVSMQCERARWRCKVIDAVWCAREIDAGGRPAARAADTCGRGGRGGRKGCSRCRPQSSNRSEGRGDEADGGFGKCMIMRRWAAAW